jgi:hypothetical protein
MPTQAEQNLDLQVFFNQTVDVALGLLGNRLLHEHETLVAEAVSTIARMIRYSVWLETGHTSFDQAWDVLKLSQAALSNVCQQLQLLPSGRREIYSTEGKRRERKGADNKGGLVTH